MNPVGIIPAEGRSEGVMELMGKHAGVGGGWRMLRSAGMEQYTAVRVGEVPRRAVPASG